jgi:hypothetical protein
MIIFHFSTNHSYLPFLGPNTPQWWWQQCKTKDRMVFGREQSGWRRHKQCAMPSIIIFFLFSSYFNSPLTNVFPTIRFQDGVVLGLRCNFFFPLLWTDSTMTMITGINPCKWLSKRTLSWKEKQSLQETTTNLEVELQRLASMTRW